MATALGGRSTVLTETRHWFMQPKIDPSPQAVWTSFLELEITGFCQLKCRHCYADSSPEGDHGTMTANDWERVIDDAQALSVDTVQFIGGEPTLHPELPRLVRYALGKGLKVDVYTNLVHVTPELWGLFSLPGVSLGTSWYSADPDRHADITGKWAAWTTPVDCARSSRSSGRPRVSRSASAATPW
ncbi:MAG: radical SAM protein [Pseudonocardiales bacterium]|nr:radical SAM protein [Pseudonocardiales bacterium]